MAMIQVTPEDLKAKSTELRGLKDQHDEAMAQIGTLVNGLNEIWKGEAQDAFLAKYQSMQGQFQQFSEMLEGYAKLMDTTADQMQESDSAAAASINGFGA